MKNLEGLVKKYRKKCNLHFTSINDIVIKEMYDQPISFSEQKAIKNFYSMRVKYLKSAVNENRFSKMATTTRLAANLVPYKEFI